MGDTVVEKMEVYHLLTMTTGHDSCVMNKIGPTMNPVKTFLELPLQHKPGEYFAYNTGASLILAVLIKIVTGKELDMLVHSFLAQEGCVGARMTGAGFGGCSIALFKKHKGISPKQYQKSIK